MIGNYFHTALIKFMVNGVVVSLKEPQMNVDESRYVHLLRR